MTPDPPPESSPLSEHAAMVAASSTAETPAAMVRIFIERLPREVGEEGRSYFPTRRVGVAIGTPP
ncbi:hypothetical protein Pflav_052190 [Phytohabitans flavus]|uniref:Uncharacterized protein n=1 Tax=Phytohabitans flavus TaxID=1076124 RepID=A0A6F8XYD6_9ACTN|nr:hypothetical protein Pflav_052190 [Phytohabitans flavus]